MVWIIQGDKERRARSKTKRVAYFVMMGNNDSTTYAAMKKIAGHPVATLSITQDELKSSVYLDKVNKFSENLREH